MSNGIAIRQTWWSAYVERVQMIEELQKKLKSRWETFTLSEQKIATYLLQNIGGIAFETAASLARHIGVSPMTVGRFLRNLGYEGLNELKDDLRGEAPWLPLYKTPAHLADASVSEGLQAEIRDLTNAHALALTPEWTAIVDLLVKAERISVASFHHGRFLGLGFASLLQHVKPRTRFVEGSDGAYIDMLLDAGPGDCLVLIDFRRYYRHFRLLAEEAARRGIPLVIVTDSQCYWARQLTDHVLMIPIDEARAWHNFGPAMSLLSLLIGAVARRQEQAGMFDRIDQITRLRQTFAGYVEAPALGDPPAGKARPKATGKRATAKRPSKRP